MLHKLSLITLLASLLLYLPAQAIILDEEQPKPMSKPKHHGKSPNSKAPVKSKQEQTPAAQNGKTASSAPSGILKIALDLWKAGDCTSAEVAFDRILTTEPRNVLANYYYADCLMQSGQTQGIKTFLEYAAAGNSVESFKAQVLLNKFESQEREAKEKVAQERAVQEEKHRQEVEVIAKQKQWLEAIKKNAPDIIANIQMVALPNGLLMGKYEVTQAQWAAVMGSNTSYFTSCGDNCPVEMVSWDDVQDFLQRLNSQTGKQFRLPTEEEWDDACQADSSTEYCGSDSQDAVAWYESNSGSTTHAVGGKQANAWGLYDMSGNVYEWTSSCSEDDCTRRIHLGGSYGWEPIRIFEANRYRDDTSHRDSNLGFRLAQDR